MSQKKKFQQEFDKGFKQAVEFFELALNNTKFVGPKTRDRIHNTIENLLLSNIPFDERKAMLDGKKH